MHRTMERERDTRPPRSIFRERVWRGLRNSVARLPGESRSRAPVLSKKKQRPRGVEGLQAVELRHCIIRMQGYGRSFRIAAVHLLTVGPGMGAPVCAGLVCQPIRYFHRTTARRLAADPGGRDDTDFGTD